MQRIYSVHSTAPTHDQLALQETIFHNANGYLAMCIRARYEIYRQNVGDADPITLELTGKTANYDSSLDNMGGVITVFTY